MVDAADNAQPLDALTILQETHCFPCEVMIKVIGRAEGDFVERVLSAVVYGDDLAERPTYRTRSTPNGKYVSLTLEPIFESEEEVLLLYERIRGIDGVVMVM